MRQPLDPFSEVVNENRRWDPEWYTWLKEVATATTRLETALPPDTSGLQAQITVLQGQVGTLQGQVGTLQGQVATLQAAPPTGLVFIQRQAITVPVGAIAFTGLTTAYDTYIFEGANLATSADGSIVFFVSQNNGASWITGAGYYNNIIYGYNSSGSSSAFQTPHENVNAFYLTHAVTGAGYPYNASFTLKAKGASVPAHGVCIVESGLWNGSLQAASWYSAGVIGSSAQNYNAILFVPAVGSFTAGSITLYGARKI